LFGPERIRTSVKTGRRGLANVAGWIVAKIAMGHRIARKARWLWGRRRIGIIFLGRRFTCKRARRGRQNKSKQKRNYAPHDHCP
jgi:hypothetical protein